MIIQIGTDVDESRILWKHKEADEWSKADIDDLILAFESAQNAKPNTGHWYIREYEYFTCSECGEDYWNSCDSTAEAEELLETGDYPNFCPNCGAKMYKDGEDE